MRAAPTAATAGMTPALIGLKIRWAAETLRYARAQRLKRVFRIDIETCEHCGGAVKINASTGKIPSSPTVWRVPALRAFRHESMSE